MTAAYTYDALHRLTAFSAGTSSRGYTYDRNGNILTRTTGTTTLSYTYSSSSTPARLDATRDGTISAMVAADS